MELIAALERTLEHLARGSAPVRLVEATTFHSGVVLLRHERVR